MPPSNDSHRHISPVDIHGYYDATSTVVVSEIMPSQPSAPQEKKLPSFDILLYTGGKLHLPELRYPIVIRLSAMRYRNDTPVLYDHDQTQILGSTEQVTVGNNVRVSGKFTGPGYQKYAVIRTATEDKHPWQASIRAHATKVTMIGENETKEINGQQISGPCYVAEESILREVTITPIGVDHQTQVTITAMVKSLSNPSPNQEPKMPPETPSQPAPAQSPATPAASPITIDVQGSAGQSHSHPPIEIDLDKINARVAANEERIAQIRTICASFNHPTFVPDGTTTNVDLCAHAIRNNWAPDIVKAIANRSDRPQSMPAIHSASNELPTEVVIEAALCRAANVTGGSGSIDLEKNFSAQTLETVDRNPDLRRGVGIQQLLLMCAYIGGMATTRRFSRIGADEIGGVIRAAFSTNAMSSIVSNAANKFMVAGFKQVEQHWRKIAATRPVNNFLEIESYRLISDGSFELIPRSGQIPAGQVSDQAYGNKAEEYGKYITVDRKAIINDDPGILTQAPMQLARGAGKTLNKIFWAEFLKDKSTFFSSARGNYAAGAATDLSLEGLSLAQSLLRQIKDDGGAAEDGAPMDTMGRFLVCGAGDEALAQALFVSQLIQSGRTNGQPSANVHANKYEPVATAYLTDPDEWFLLADPADLAMIEIAFLNGNTEPMISEALPMATNTGFVLNGLYDFGVRKQEYRAGVHLKGKV